MERLTREMTFEEEYIFLQKEVKELFDKEDKESEPPESHSVVRRALRCIKKLVAEVEPYKVYKDLEEQGLLVRLPCKLGDDLYWISDEDDDGDPIPTIKEEEHGVTNILINESGIFVNTCDYPPSGCDKLGGRYALLSRKEAEAKLKELREKED